MPHDSLDPEPPSVEEADRRSAPEPATTSSLELDRRRFTTLVAGFGVGSLTSATGLFGEVEGGGVTSEALAAAARLSGVEFTGTERELMLDGLRDLLTNLTGHPAVVLPNGFRANGTPTSLTFCGRLFGEEKLLSLAHAYQTATDFHLRIPQL